MKHFVTTYVVQMTELDAFERLPENFADTVGVESVGTALEVVEHRVVDKLEHEVQALLTPEHFDQVHQVFVTKCLNISEKQSYTLEN